MPYLRDPQPSPLRAGLAGALHLAFCALVASALFVFVRHVPVVVPLAALFVVALAGLRFVIGALASFRWRLDALCGWRFEAPVRGLLADFAAILLYKAFAAPFFPAPWGHNELPALVGLVAVGGFLVSGVVRWRALETAGTGWPGVSGLLRWPILWIAALAAVLSVARPVLFDDAYLGYVDEIKSARLARGGVSSAWAFELVMEDLVITDPMWIEAHPVVPQRFLVLDRSGLLLSVDENGLSRGGVDPAHDAVLDLRAEVGDLVAERGAFSFAIRPDQKALLLTYMTAEEDAASSFRLSQFPITTAEPLRVGAEQVLIEMLNRHGWHNGGGLAFGPDGYLYVGMGDEGGVNDSFENSQTLSKNFYTGILRLDVGGGTDPSASKAIGRQPVDGTTKGYRIPLSNPFVGQAEALEEFYAIGFRNAFRFSFDEADGRLWAADVGQELIEEINVVESGGNYGWALYEGSRVNREAWNRELLDDVASLPGELRFPLYEYPHDGLRACALGGFVDRSRGSAALYGRYIFGDCVSGEVFALELDGGEVERIAVRPPGLGVISAVVPYGNRIRLLVLSSAKRKGGIYELRRSNAPLLEAVATGEDMYGLLCSRCHGVDGQYLLEESVQPRDFSDRSWQASVSDELIAAVIRDGGAEHGLSDVMPEWGESLSEEQIARLVEVIRSFGS